MIERGREIVRVPVTDQYGNTLIAEAYNGMLPEDMLILLMEQAISLKSIEVEGDARTEEWHGPNDKLQEAICQGVTATPLERG